MEPRCGACQDKGYVVSRSVGGIEACPACAAAAEQQYRIYQELREQEQDRPRARRGLRLVSEAA